jgi:Domain of unknown function (DUF1906)
MWAPGTRDSAAARRRYLALSAAGVLGVVFVIAVGFGPRTSVHPAAHGKASARMTARGTGASAPSQDTEAAKQTAEADRSANLETDASASQVLKPQPSWNAPPQVVRFHGYSFKVPGSWPVYNLAASPSQCVLFNAHAVYLGTPGEVPNCPAMAFGRTEALLIQPVTPGSVPASAVVLADGDAGLPEHAALPAAATDNHMIQVDVPAAGVLVTATYGANEPRLRAILAGATISGRGAAPGSNSSSSSGAAVRGPSQAPPSVAPVAAQSGTSATSKEKERISQLTPMVGSGVGLDTCTVPSVATMTSWLASPYRVIGTYLGGMNWACGYGNFSVSWVRRVAAEGWRFMPIWVGRQAPCTTVPGAAVIDPSHAAAEGLADARAAVTAARAFGYGRGTPIYFDMEAYNSIPGCSSAVMTFLGGWTRGLHAAGYASGVYSSARSGIEDLASQVAANRGYPRPNDIWIADWNGEPVLSDSALRNGLWVDHQRLHQYAGPHGEKWGGATLQLDSDAIDGLVVGLPAVPDLPRPTESARPSELTIAPGATGRVRLTLHGVPRTPVDVRWRVDARRGMAATPSYGSVYLWPGAVYSVTVTLAPARSLAPGRYLAPITVTSGAHPITEAFVLVSVVRSGRSLPTAHPIVLYAADAADMAIAARIRREFSLPPGDVTGRFSRAWKDTASDKDVVIAVGEPAANALYFNVCGWANPAGWHAGVTPFYYLGYPLRNPAGRNYFELASSRTIAGSTQLATQLVQYALAGTLPNYGSEPAVPAPPTLSCRGAPNVKVPS